MEVYIDDILVKSLEAEDHMSHLQQAFSTLRKYNMKLNPAKCSFGVSSGKFLGYIVTHRGVEANPEQIRAIHSIHFPKNVKEEVRLRGEINEEGEWILQVDGSSNVRGAGVGIVLTSEIRNTTSGVVRCNFKATNNESEYETLITGLTLAHQMGAENIQVFGDSQLIINQNSKVDALANLWSALETNSQMNIPLLVLQWPANLEEPPSEEVSTVEEGETWMTLLIRYLEADILPEDRSEARKTKKQAARYCIS
ncbi:PREDICTED: uncharacterized protein LOC106338440 [Brassica oleracea var. oleracea]|uniref:uncharacterized protein LOC106338440 n=1 Tax=Brassica oleracea var. oleracea TaxID=109376 RepID=UPI0006A709D2|nr:PREDICTED: uncharacterized protein LOC106338440 [Brassica oleracea var. oleracea]